MRLCIQSSLQLCTTPCCSLHLDQEILLGTWVSAISILNLKPNFLNKSLLVIFSQSVTALHRSLPGACLDDALGGPFSLALAFLVKNPSKLQLPCLETLATCLPIEPCLAVSAQQETERYPSTSPFGCRITLWMAWNPKESLCHFSVGLSEF